jgi:hypothetical protein
VPIGTHPLQDATFPNRQRRADEEAPPIAGGEQRFAHELLAHLNKSRTPWISTETHDASR